MSHAVAPLDTIEVISHANIYLRDILSLLQLVRVLRMKTEPCHNKAVQQVLGFRRVTHDVFRLLPASAIYQYARNQRSRMVASEEEDLVSKNVLRKLITGCFTEVPCNRALKTLDRFRPMLEPRSRHESPPLHLVIQIVLRMVLVLDSLRDLDQSATIMEQKRSVKLICARTPPYSQPLSYPDIYSRICSKPCQYRHINQTKSP